MRLYYGKPRLPCFVILDLLLFIMNSSLFICFLQIPGHMSVFINEPKLSDFKMVLLQEGIQAEFSAGALVCNETIAVRRVSSYS